MDIRAIKEALDAEIIEGREMISEQVDQVYASDLMSDVLAFGQPDSMLITGLATQQAVISAHMAEFKGVVFIRGKHPKDGAGKFARENGLVILRSNLDMYDACVRIENLIKGEQGELEARKKAAEPEKLLLSQERFMEGSDFANAGMISTEIKSVLKKIGFDPKLIRRVAIATYEGEMNVVMHAKRARVFLTVTPQIIEVVIDDEGKGIPDVDKAMQAGFSTATEEQRAMGFGSGMGLPNIRRNTDELNIESQVGKGTRLKMRFMI
jgi:anti-sigma regulatory factor (Ser/Thr protein kinase)